jgi:hypothetical protein
MAYYADTIFPLFTLVGGVGESMGWETSFIKTSFPEQSRTGKKVSTLHEFRVLAWEGNPFS